MQKHSRLFVTLVVTLTLLIGMSLGASATVRLSLGTGSMGGTFYVYGGGFANIVNNHVPGVEILVEGTPGTVANLSLLQNNRLDMTLAECVPTYERMKAMGWAAEEPAFTNVRALTPMYFAHFGMWSLASSDIKSIYDFEGKTVGPGPFGSGAERMARNTLEVLGVNPILQNMGWGDSCTALGDRRLDAVTISTGHPSPALMDLESRREVRHIPLSQEDIEKVRSVHPHYGLDTIPAGTYRELDFDYVTIGTWDAVLVRTDFDEELAYNITKAIFEHLDILINTHPTAKQSIPENILNQPIPIHVGALRYYQEIGLDIPDHLIPDEAK